MIVRKRLFYSSFFIARFVLPFLVFLAAATVSLVAQSPIGEWKFDEGGGNVAFDASGNGNAARLSNGMRWSHDVGGWAVSSSDTDRGVVSTPSLDLSASQATSISLWVNRNYTTAGGVLIASGGNGAASNPGFALFPDDETCHGMRATLHGNAGTTANCYAQPSSGVWHQLTVVYDKTQTGGDQISLYVDGVPQSPAWNLASATNTDKFGNNPIHLFSGGGSSQFSSGEIRNLRIYDRALTAGEIQQTYAGDLQVPTPAVGISFVQGGYAAPQTPQTTVNVTFNAPQSAGDLNVVVVGWNDSTAVVNRVADSKGNTYTRAVGPTIQTGIATQSIYYAKNIAAAGVAGNVVTVTFSTAAVSPDVRILEYSGADHNNPVDVTAANVGSSTLSNSGSATTTNATDLIFGANLVQTLTTGPGVGFTNRILTVPDGDIAEDKSVSATGSYVATAPVSPAGSWIMQMVAFRTPTTGSFTIAASPSSLSVAQGHQGSSTITTAVSGGFNSAISLSASGVPSGTTVSFSPNPIPAPGSGSSTMTITVGASTPTGTYPITVTGSGGGVQNQTTVTLTVTAGPNFSISASPASLSVSPGHQGLSTITTAISNGFNSAITLSASGVPSGTTVSFSPNPIPAPGSGNSTMTITVGASTPPGTYPIAVTGNGGGVQQSTTVTLTVIVPSFTISASPSSLTIATGNQGTSTITTAISGGFNSSISLSATGAPSGTTVSFNPATIPAPGSGSSTMTIVVGSNTPPGTYPITVTGNGGGIQESTTITLTVTAPGPGITLDGNIHGVHDNGTTYSTTAAVTIGTPTAGDLISCEVSFDSGGGNSLVSVADNSNGAYTGAIPIHLDSNLQQWFGIYYVQNAVASSTTITLTTSQSRPYLAIACQAWKGVAASNSLDTNFGQMQDGVSLQNPLTGTNKTPAGNGELVVAGVGLQHSGTPTAGTNYSLIDGAPTTQWWPEYWIQGTATATAGNYTWQTDSWTDEMAAFRPAAMGNFTISASPTSLTVAQGHQGTSTITTAISGGFNNSISLSASGLPSGTTASFSPNPIPAPGSGNSTMTISVGGSTPAGTYPITVTGNGGGTQQSTTVTLTVTAGPSFTVSASPSSLSVIQESQGTSTITVAVSGGFNYPVSLSVSGTPSGTTVTFNPVTLPAPGSGTSVMTITVGTTLQGTYPLTVTATGNGIQQTTIVNLTVMAEVQLSWTASQSPGIAGYNIYRSTTSGGTYTKINSSLDTTTTYNDLAVQDGGTYYYVTTAVNNQGQESPYSNQASATVP